MNINLKLGSLFDGSGGFTLGGAIAGIKPIWASEIEPFPIRVTTKRLPEVKHLGDISKINGGEIEPVDIITFGSPCQDMSVAGKRDGLDGSRSSLFYEAIRVIKEMREKTNGKYPRFIVWENVPGAFSSNKGEDFRAVLKEVCQVKDETVFIPGPPKGKWRKAGCVMGDGYSVAWRTLDAQYWGVPQRRSRIFLVADFAGGCASEILFKSESLPRYSPQGFRTWQKNTSSLAGGIRSTGEPSTVDFGRTADRIYINADKSVTLSAQGGGMGAKTGLYLTPKTLKIRSGCEGGGKGALIQNDLSATLGCNNDQTLFAPKAYGICSKDSNSMKSDNPNSGFYEANTSRCLDANGGNPACNQGGVAFCSQSYSEWSDDNKGASLKASGGCLGGGSENLAVMAVDSYNRSIVNDMSGNTEYAVRRLTPTECARLQGFPDWWSSDLGTEKPTAEEIGFWAEVFETHRKIMGKSSKPKSEKQIVKWLNNPHTDSAEYKMWGNGVALPCVYYIMQGIAYHASNKKYISKD